MDGSWLSLLSWSYKERWEKVWSFHYYSKLPRILAHLEQSCYPYKTNLLVLCNMWTAENDPHDGKRKCETLWPIFKIAHQKSRYIFDFTIKGWNFQGAVWVLFGSRPCGSQYNYRMEEGLPLLLMNIPNLVFHIWSSTLNQSLVLSLLSVFY